MSDSFDYFNPDRKRLRLKQLADQCYPDDAGDAPKDALNRLFDHESRPQLADYKAVLRAAPQLRDTIDRWLKGREMRLDLFLWNYAAEDAIRDAIAERRADESLKAKQTGTPSEAQTKAALRAMLPTAPAIPERHPATVASGKPDTPKTTPDWADGATVSELAEARGCTPQNVSKAIKRLRARNQLDGRDGQTRGHWPAEHAKTIWAELKRNARKRKL